MVLNVMTNEEIAVELAILRSWQEQFPTDDKDEQLAQKLHKERLQSELIFRAKRTALASCTLDIGERS